MDYQTWEQGVPVSITGDALWKVQAYRLALFAADVAWRDVSKLLQDRRTRSLSDQMYRALGSVSANIAEGYSRGTARDRAHFYEYALGSAREGRDWYYKARHVLDKEAVEQQVALLTQIIRLLLRMVPEQRERALREEPSVYEAGGVLLD